MNDYKKIKNTAIFAMLMVVACPGICASASERSEKDSTITQEIASINNHQKMNDKMADWLVDDEPEIISDDHVEYPQAQEDYAQQFVDTYGPLYDAATRIPCIKAKDSDKMVYYEYDQNGNRVGSFSGDEYIKLRFSEDFYWGTKVIAKEKNGIELTFSYNELERCTGIEYDGKHYNLLYDEFGYVSGIENDSHEIIARYVYDENDYCKVYGKDENGEWTENIEDPDFIGLQNPIRLDGSYYDELSGYYMSGGSSTYDAQTGEWIRDESILEQIHIINPAADTTKSDIDKEVDNLTNSSSYGKKIKYQANGAWCTSLSKQEILARLIYAECIVVSDQPAVTWEVLNRKAANWSGFYGSGNSNTLKNIATKSGQYTCISGNEQSTINARNPAVNDSRWEKATWYACALCAAPSRSKLGSLIAKPSGFDKQCNHVGMVYYNKFNGTTAATLKYNTNPVKNVMIVGVNRNITSSTTIHSYYSDYKDRNIFFNFSEDYPSKYDFT